MKIFIVISICKNFECTNFNFIEFLHDKIKILYLQKISLQDRQEGASLLPTESLTFIHVNYSYCCLKAVEPFSALHSSSTCNYKTHCTSLEKVTRRAEALLINKAEQFHTGKFLLQRADCVHTAPRTSTRFNRGSTIAQRSVINRCPGRCRHTAC